MDEICDVMPRHLKVITRRDGKTISEVPIADPFHTTLVEMETRFSWWDLFKLLWKPYRTVVTVRVEGDDVPMKHWFATGDGRKSITDLEKELEERRANPLPKISGFCYAIDPAPHTN